MSAPQPLMGGFIKSTSPMRVWTASALLILAGVTRVLCWQGNLLPQRGGSMARFVTIPPDGRKVTLIVQTSTGRWVVPVPPSLKARVDHAIATGSQPAADALLQSIMQRTWYDPLWSVAEKYKVNLKPLPPITPEGTLVRLPRAARVKLQQAIVLVGGPHYRQGQHQVLLKHAAVARHPR